jgi:hypothetical protein
MYNSTLPYVHAYMQAKIAHICLHVRCINVHTAAENLIYSTLSEVTLH